MDAENTMQDGLHHTVPEILVFSLGENEQKTAAKTPLFGVEVSRVREIVLTPTLTSIPGARPVVAGMASLRGELMAVIDLSQHGLKLKSRGQHVIVVEPTADSKLGLLVDSVQSFARRDRESKALPREFGDGLLSRVTPLADGRLASIIEITDLPRLAESPALVS